MDSIFTSFFLEDEYHVSTKCFLNVKFLIFLQGPLRLTQVHSIHEIRPLNLKVFFFLHLKVLEMVPLSFRKGQVKYH